MHIVVTPWLDHNREYYVRFVGTEQQCRDYKYENYGEDDTYAKVIPVLTPMKLKRGDIIPIKRI